MEDRVMFRHQNEGASCPLVIAADVMCNTSDEQILSNVLQNSRRPNRWIKTQPPHDRIAIICGSGPSIADCLGELGQIKGDIFALNNAATWLHGKGFIAHYQVILDAQPRTRELIGPARTHLFASMVDPSLFDQVPTAVLWHATHGDVMVDEQEGFPKREDDYCLIGSGVTVGNTVLPLIYALGYRKIHVFGMDSSHKGGEGHVTPQAINDGDPCTLVEFMGRKYVCSFTMKLQADNFVQRAKALEADGCDIEMHGDGYLQAIWKASRGQLDEKTKYTLLWSMPEYRECGSPGAASAEDFVRLVRPKQADTVLDIGCGPGMGGKAVKMLTGCQVSYVDIASNCGAPEPFFERDIGRDPLPKADYGYCCDVMEHIPPEEVDAVISNIMGAVSKAFFRISLLDDIKGALIGHKLHLSVHPSEWWRNKLSSFGNVIFMHNQVVMAYFYVESFTGE